MTSFLGSTKIEISDSLKRLESQSLECKGPKKWQENLGPSPFQISYKKKKKLWHAPQTHRTRQEMEEGWKPEVTQGSEVTPFLSTVSQFKWLVIYPMPGNNAMLAIDFTDLRKWNFVRSLVGKMIRNDSTVLWMNVRLITTNLINSCINKLSSKSTVSWKYAYGWTHAFVFSGVIITHLSWIFV